jgi:hypothetical protein
MAQLLDLIFELAKNWRVFVPTVACGLLGIILASQFPTVGAYFFLGGLGAGMGVGFIWQSKQPTFNV